MDPFTIAAIASGGLKLGGAIFGRRKARKAERKRRDILRTRMRDNEQWFNSEFYKDYLDNPDSKAYLKTLSKNLYKNMEATNNNAVASGATAESKLAAKEKANEIYSNAVNKLVQHNDAKKRSVRREYMNRKDGLLDQKSNLAKEESQSWMNFIDNLSSVGDSAMMAFATPGGGGGAQNTDA